MAGFFKELLMRYLMAALLLVTVPFTAFADFAALCECIRGLQQGDRPRPGPAVGLFWQFGFW